ncbi:MAG: hypothetical protein EBS97_06175 [Verrucomicrobia bacterium]|nr:hypothetical protein [Verrucomicrobiota bacterium]
MTLTLSTPRNFRPGETKEEQVKVVKDGLDVIKDLPRYAKEGAQAIEPDDFMRFKWYGVYQQKPKEDGYFMLRTRIPGGQLNPAQLREIAALTDQFAHGFGDVTTRQTIQLHYRAVSGNFQAPGIGRDYFQRSLRGYRAECGGLSGGRDGPRRDSGRYARTSGR